MTKLRSGLRATASNASIRATDGIDLESPSDANVMVKEISARQRK